MFVKRNGVFVGGDINLPQRFVRFFAGHAHSRHIDEHQVVVGAAGDNAKSFGDKGVCQNSGIGDDLFLIGFKFVGHGFFKGDGFGCNDMHQGAALSAGEDGFVDGFGVLCFAENEAASGAAQCLVGCRGDDVRMGNG